MRMYSNLVHLTLSERTGTYPPRLATNLGDTSSKRVPDWNKKKKIWSTCPWKVRHQEQSSNGFEILMQLNKHIIWQKRQQHIILTTSVWQKQHLQPKRLTIKLSGQDTRTRNPIHGKRQQEQLQSNNGTTTYLSLGVNNWYLNSLQLPGIHGNDESTFKGADLIR